MDAKPNIALAIVTCLLLRGRQVTSLVEDRIRPEELLPTDKYPAIVYGTVATTPFDNLEGPSDEAQTRPQFNCYGDTVDEANQVADAVQDILNGYRGFLGDSPAEGEVDARLFVSDCVRQNRYTRKAPLRPGSARSRIYTVVDFLVTHSEALPSLTLE